MNFLRAMCLYGLAGLAFLAQPSQAADWLVVAKDKLRSVELDRSTVMSSDGGSKIAWGRIVVADAHATVTGYKSIRVLNRYDCSNRSFSIIKRVYLSADERVLREEQIEIPSASVIRPGTVDERFYNTVCPAPVASARKDATPPRKAASLEDLGRVAQEAARRAERAKNGAPPMASQSFRRADIQLVKEEHGAKPVSKAVEAPATHAVETHSAPADAVQLPLPVRKAPPVYVAKPPSLRSIPTRVSKPLPAPPPPAHNPHAHWSYEGDTGPAAWGQMRADYALCSSGTRQSPIDIRDGIKVEQEPIVFDYKPTYFRIVDNGHTIQVNYGEGSRLSVMGRTYELVQFHFHRPSEERIDGRNFDMVVHLVHKDLDGRLAVVAVMLERGAASAFMQTLWNNLPLEKNEEYLARAAINASDILPARREYYSYMGSLTTPPCTEGVLWLVMKNPSQLSEEQIAVFSRFYRNNARPIQPQNARIIKESR